MLNVEGDYAEIVAWLDSQDRWGVGYYRLHGDTDDGRLNVGLFSVNEDHRDPCSVCQGVETGGMVTNFSLKEITLSTDEDEYIITVEEPDRTHMITF